MVIGVGVADSPTGPFRDALGRPLVGNNEIDPSVFIDDDGQAYLYWGNPGLWYVKLNADMISYSAAPRASRSRRRASAPAPGTRAVRRCTRRGRGCSSATACTTTSSLRSVARSSSPTPPPPVRPGRGRTGNDHAPAGQ
ncbi:family 43 glycosylhydrolase [Micromonospora sp. M12]